MNQKEKLCKEDGTDKIDLAYFRSLIGYSRPDILNVVSILSWFMHCASELHLKAAKRMIRYVKDTCNFDIKFTRSKEFKLVGFSDSDCEGSIDDLSSIDDLRSTSGFSWFLVTFLKFFSLKHMLKMRGSEPFMINTIKTF